MGKQGVSPRLVHVGFVVDKVVLDPDRCFVVLLSPSRQMPP
jgi:hypothetical protein